MRTPRTFMLMAPGLFMSFVAAAQTPAMSAANQDMLSWLLRVLLGAVCLVAVLAGIALTVAAANRESFRPQAAATSPAVLVAPGVELPLAPAVETLAIPTAKNPVNPVAHTLAIPTKQAPQAQGLFASQQH